MLTHLEQAQQYIKEHMDSLDDDEGEDIDDFDDNDWCR